ncbi:MAG TPA: VIT domain-containing protein, partial [Kofleriaceae bacterium]|nr:VIT domain-containing protein [Kofleriaceae bacterium]
MMPIPVTIDERLARCLRPVDTGFGALETARGGLPLTRLDVDARAVGLEVAIDVRQTFVNATRVAIEATYIFPLPDRAAVRRFRMTVGDRVVDGVLDERGRARATYDQAIAAGHRAAIAEEDRAGVFTLRVGNLMPGEAADIELGLVGPLSVDDGEVTFAFPLVVAPRYIPGVALGGDQAGLGVAGDTDRTPDASRITPPVLLPGHRNPVRLGFTMTIDGGGLPIANLASGLHELHAATDGAGWRVELEPGERLDRDVVLRWSIGNAELRSSAVWAADERGEGATVMVTMVPPVGAAAAARPRDVVFVLDRSGSMGGWKIVAARRAVARMIDTLTARDRFTIVLFDDRTDEPPGFHGLVDATDRRRFEAVEFLARVEARGGTELAVPLELATAHLRAEIDAGTRDRSLVLITDGQVGNEDEILRRLAPRLDSARVFTLGIDQAVNA